MVLWLKAVKGFGEIERRCLGWDVFSVWLCMWVLYIVYAGDSLWG